MIRYSLQCEHDHEFDGWFSSSDDYETQLRRGLVTCPVCNSPKVAKQLMAPGVSGTRKSNDKMVPVTTVPPQQREVLEKLRAFRKELEKTATDVGDKFPEEVRKIHYGEEEERGIFGKATPEEAGELLDEGIPVLPIPELPEDKN